MFHMTAHEREQAFQSLNMAVDAMAHYRKAEDFGSKLFELHVMRQSILAARALRLAGIDYPSIP